MGSGKGEVETEATSLGQVTFTHSYHIYLTILRFLYLTILRYYLKGHFCIEFATRWKSGDGSEMQWELGKGSGLVTKSIYHISIQIVYIGLAW